MLRWLPLSWSVTWPTATALTPRTPTAARVLVAEEGRPERELEPRKAGPRGERTRTPTPAAAAAARRHFVHPGCVADQGIAGAAQRHDAALATSAAAVAAASARGCAPGDRASAERMGRSHRTRLPSARARLAGADLLAALVSSGQVAAAGGSGGRARRRRRARPALIANHGT